MRLPIYRKLDERFRLLGLSMLELGVLGGMFVLLSQCLGFWTYGLLFTLVVTLTVYLFLVIVHRRFESHFLAKWLRAASLPERLSQKIFNVEHYKKWGEGS